MCGTQDEHERAGCDESDRRFARANSVHFYGRTPPWGDNCGLCVLYGFVCNSAQWTLALGVVEAATVGAQNIAEPSPGW